MAQSNPNVDRITDAMWRFWLGFKAIEPSAQLGGIYADKSGYHNTRAANARRWPGNYSIREHEDQGGPGDKAAAIDLTFPDAQRGDYRTISKYMKRLLASGKDRDDERLNDWREFYGQADSDGHVEGWDCRHLVDITSDASHLWHIHGSVDRDKADHWPTFEAALSVLAGEPLLAWRERTGRATTPPASKPVPSVPPAPSGHKPGTRVLRLTSPQMAGEDVRFVQRWIGPARAGAADGVYGPTTRDAVRWYQRMRGIGVDGEVGPQTFRQMGIAWKA